MITIIKRNGEQEKFKVSKIKEAVKKCASASGINVSEYVESMMSRFPYDTNSDILLEVEKIQDWVISDMRQHLSEDLANEYSNYREMHSKIRDSKYNKRFYNTIMELVTGKDNDTSQENANKNAKQNNVIRDLMAGETSKKLYREMILSDKIKEYHDKGLLHLHDMDYRIVPSIINCQLINLFDILENGTVINDKLIESPKTLKTAATIATQVSLAVANSSYGGQTISLAHLAPWVRKSREKYESIIRNNDMTSKLDPAEFDAIIDTLLNQEIKDSIQTLNYQWNSFVSTNGQAPFVSVWMQVTELKGYEEETAMLIEEMLRQRIKGMKAPNGQWINPTFPKLLFGLEEATMNPESDYFYLSQLAAECTAKRMVPDYISIPVMKKVKQGCITPPMGCRSMLTPYFDENNKPKVWGRANLGVISLNIPYVALESKTKEEFFNKLSEYAETICQEQYKIAERVADSPVERAPILWQYGVLARLPQGSKIGDLIRTHKGYMTISLGYTGIAEAVYRFGIEYVSEEGHEFAEKILKTLKKVTDAWASKTPYAFSLYGTPSESLTTKFAKALKRFKKIPKVNDHDYVTNSFHVPVTYQINAYDKISFESSLQGLTSGGVIMYIEAPDVRNNPQAVFNIMKYIYNNALYCEVNTTSCDVCYNCGYEGEIEMLDHMHFKCPKCGNTDKDKLYVCRRMCGYLGSLSTGTTLGRWKDIQDRVKHI